MKKPEPFEVNRRKEEVQKVDQQVEKPSHLVKKTQQPANHQKIQRNRLMQA